MSPRIHLLSCPDLRDVKVKRAVSERCITLFWHKADLHETASWPQSPSADARPPTRFPIVPGERMEFAELAALIRLSHKYHVEDLHTRTLHHLKLYFTNDLAAWDAAGADGTAFLRIAPADALAAVALARLAHADSVLPTALYLCCQLDGELINGVERADGGRELLEPRDLEEISGNDVVARLSFSVPAK